eukprot:CAMPEP_0174715942 /NCGR_PEP_ID=MMETSP1094-20130205/22699_1 /TAXON_ID=156173 /ORGANISM="Chrysochromulina brevifilum, Strain UTEX LB 985" /LENGTH=39 /DNA_ID= /DNA_START= /DNA_END= /DNA_ORIENTATION=
MVVGAVMREAGAATGSDMQSHPTGHRPSDGGGRLQFKTH